MKKKPFATKKIGILGGGQLAQMMILSGIPLGIEFFVVDPDPQAPAGQIAHHFCNFRYDQKEKIANFFKTVDCVTYDLENLPLKTLEFLKKKAIKQNPTPQSLASIQDKGLQKQKIVAAKIKTASFCLVDNPSEQEFLKWGYPLVQKLRKGGYDGYGVRVLKNKRDFVHHLKASSLLEKKVSIKKELSVLVCRAKDDSLISYPVVEMVVNKKLNRLDYLLTPANLSKKLTQKAIQVAKKVARAFKIVGIVGVELFLTTQDEILVNEIAPRPHNSGHFTQLACYPSQFEQHLRAVIGWPLIKPEFFCPAATVNLLGSGQKVGLSKLKGLPKILKIEGVKPHLYNKTQAKPGRKMGHVNVTAKSRRQLLQKIKQIKEQLKIHAS